MFKKFILIFSIIACLLSINVFALQLSNEFYVYGQDNKELSKAVDMSESELKKYCENNNITFLAVNKTNTKQIRRTEIEDAFSKKIGNFFALKDNEIIDLAEELTGFSGVKGTVFEKGNKKFLKVEVKSSDSGGEYYLTQYITVSDSKKEILSFHTSSKESTDYVEEVFSSQFKTSKSSPALKVLSVIGMVLFGGLALVVLIAIIKDTFEKRPTD